MARFRSLRFLTSTLSGTLLLSLLLSGCGSKPGAGTATTPPPPLVKHGMVQGGGEPVSSSTIQLYAVGTTGDGSAATALLTQPVSTDANGEFNIAGDYTCPSPTALVYVVATGGNPGLAAGTNNSALAMMSALGACGGLTATEPFYIDELTTVAAVWALAPYMSSYSSIGSTPADAAAMADAFTQASYYANPATGMVPGLNVPANMTVPVTQIDTLADILASCVNTAGGSVGDGSACGTLFAAATPVGGAAPANVLLAGLNIANNPTANISGLFALVGASAPYQPTLEAPPPNLGLGLSSTAGLSVFTSALTFPATTVGTASTPVSVMLVNTSAATVTLSGTSFSGAAASDFSITAGCPVTLAAGASCTLQVVFTPSAVGTRSASLSISSSAPTPPTISLTGTGVTGGGTVTTPPASSLSVSPSALTFPSATVGIASTPLSATVTNTGAVAITLSAATFSGAAAGDYSVAAGCPATLAVGASCTVQVVFTPSATGARSASLSIPNNTANSPLTVPLTGTGVAGGGGSGPPPPTLYGHVEGGVQPVSSSTIQMYAVGTIADGSAATSLLTQQVSTDANGDFNIAGGYTCPSATSLVYMVATGGNPGLAAGTNNTALTMMAALGACGNLTASTPIYVNELTTVAAVWALAPYMSSYSSIGSSAGDAAALANAFTLASYYANPSTGTMPGSNVPAGTTVPVEEINTLADILATCVDSSGGTVGDGSACGTLFAATTPVGGAPPGNVISAGLNIANSPTANVAALFGLVPASPAFQPTLTEAPADFTVGLAMSGLSASPGAILYPATYVSFTGTSQTVTISNNGTRPFALNANMYGNVIFSIIGVNASDFSTTNTCSTSLAPTATCTAQITFVPSANGVRNAALVIASNAENSPLIVPLSGAGLVGSGGPITLSPSSLNFTQVGVPQNVTVANTGSLPVTIGGVTYGGDTSSTTSQTNDCGPSLAAQSICTLSVQVSYLDQYVQNGTLSVITSAASGTATMAIQVPATSPPLESFSLSPITLGTWAVGVTSPALTIYGNPTVSSTTDNPYYSVAGSFVGPNASDFSLVQLPLYSSGTASAYACFRGSCEVTVAFTPGGPGLRTATLQTGLGNIPVSGNGIPAGPSFSISPFPSTSESVGTSSSPTNLTIVNNGSTTLLLSKTTVTGPNAGDFAVSNQCGASLGSTGTCTNLTVVFTPTQLGPRTATLTITDATSGTSKSIPLNGTGGTMPPIVTPSLLTFTNIDIGSVATQTVTVTAPNGDPVSFQAGNSKEYTLSTGTCATTPCQVTITFKPSMLGSDPGSFVVTDPYSKLATNLSIVANVGLAGASLSTSSLTFAAQGVGTTSLPQVVTLTNTGDIALTISGIALNGANLGDFPIENNTCGASLAPAASCAVSISFAPSATGARSASLSIPNNTANSPLTVSLTGTGVAGGGGTPPPSSSLSVSPSALMFPSAYLGVVSAALPVAVTNTGTVAVTLSGTSFSGAAASDFTIPTPTGCPMMLAPGASCTLQVFFTPSVAGARNASLSITSDAANSPLTVSVTGTGVDTGPINPPPGSKQGNVESGATPISNAMIQLYAVGTTGDGSAATSLLTQTVSTDANGNFDLGTAYTCPSPTSLIYIVAVGGNPGLAAGTNNAALTMMTTLGACSNLTATTPIRINELTTVAAVWPLAPYIGSYSAIGSGAGDATNLADAFTLASQFVNPSTGAAPGLNVPAGWSVPVMQINLLADILAACVDTTGGVIGDGSTCGTLFAYSTPTGGTPPVETIGAGLDIANLPDNYLLFGLVTASAPYQPIPAQPTVNDLTFSLVPDFALVTLSPSVLTFPATTLNFASAPLAITLTNNTPVALTMNGAPPYGANGGDFTSIDNCYALKLAVGSSCLVQIVFTPSAVGARSANYSYAVTDAGGFTGISSPVSLSGTGVAGTGGPVTLSPTSLTFNGVGVQNVTVTNTGTMPVAIGSIAVGGAGAGALVETNNCGTVLAAQSICTISVQASVTLQGYVGTVTVVDSANPGTQSVSVNVPAQGANVSPALMDFGDWGVGVSDPYFQWMTASAANEGDYAPNIQSIPEGPNASDFKVTFQTFDDASCEGGYFDCIGTVTFSPSGVGVRTATLPTQYGTVTLTGNGIVGPDFSLVSGSDGPVFSSPAFLGNEPVGGTSFPLYMTLINTGTTTLQLVGTVSGPNASDFIYNGPCPLSPGNNCGPTITFNPSQTGVRTATVTVTDSTSGMSKTLGLSGLGVSAGPPPSAAPTLTPGQLIFSGIPLSSISATQAVTVSTPNGDGVAVSSSSPAFFVSTGTCFLKTPCQVGVRFQPGNYAGFQNATLTVVDNPTSATSSISLQGSSGAPTAVLSMSSLPFASHASGSTSISQTVTLTNTGNLPLTISGTSVTGANPGDFPIESNTCGSSLAVGANCVITISFSPTGTGARTATLQIMSNAASSPTALQLSGTGT
jgi:hypothetical protein